MTDLRCVIKFKTCDGIALRGESLNILFLGLSALKEFLLNNFAARIQEAGFTSLIYNNRCWGSSGGEPQNKTDPWRQIEYIHAAISYSLTLSDIDPNQAVVWGSSGSGGNTLTATALDPQVKTMISQVPFVSRKSAQPTAPKQSSETVEQARTSDHRVIPGTKESAEFFQDVSQKKLPPDFKWKNKITLQTYYHIFKHKPIQYIHRISPRPMLMLVAMKDSIIPTDVTMKAFDEAGDSKELVKFDCGHFEPYQVEVFNRNVQVQIKLLRKHFS
ncbi:hypothetical protein N7481_006848 [Penicillium waksmanii]|uniref:uncharacterized protein n=1 Tax=Penicillium waksmanii TaxID=69791 RepID=UPI002548F3BB|nr:uncharacterized protein N7481_006848 [Penicillium waksmanii]KAJ5979550.1 hypothetical protein N7481_006848 [Penicillium waksmanii]